MKNFLKEITALKFTPWYRWHPKIVLRYLPVVEWMQRKFKVQSSKFKVLEVGSGGLGMAPYLRMAVVGVDKEFEPPFHPLLTRVKGDATDLKFGDNSFDIVVSMDMLEHLPKGKRQKAVGEMMRVGRRLVIIGVPCGREAEKHDRELRDKGVKGEKGDRGDRGFRFLEEQVEYGLPEETDILYYIKVAARELKKEIYIEIKGNMNINLRKFLMWGWMSGNIFVNILFRKMFLALIPVFRLLDKPPFYRKIFFVNIKT